MAETKIKSGPEIVNEFIEALKNDGTLDKATVEAVVALHAEKKLTKNRLLRDLEAKRKESNKDG